MRLRISLFDLLVVVTPAIALMLGLLVAATNSANPAYLLTVAQSVLIVAVLGAVCGTFHRCQLMRAFSQAFLGGSMVLLLVMWLAQQSGYGETFPTTAALGSIWNRARPDAAQAAQVWTVPGTGYSGGYTTWPSYPVVDSTMVYTGFVPASGMAIPGLSLKATFIAVGNWSLALLAGILCGLVAKSLRRDEVMRKAEGEGKQPSSA